MAKNSSEGRESATEQIIEVFSKMGLALPAAATSRGPVAAPHPVAPPPGYSTTDSKQFVAGVFNKEKVMSPLPPFNNGFLGDGLAAGLLPGASWPGSVPVS
jgi:hypothetical protein